MALRRTRDEPYSDAWERAALSSTRSWGHLTHVELERLLEQARRFDRSRRWEGLDNLVISDEMRSVVSTHACLLTVNIDERVLSDVTTIIIAPSSVVRRAHQDAGGSMVSEGVVCILGEAAMHGPVRFAWDQIVAERPIGNAKTSVLIHEFAHKVDMSDGFANGIPPIRDRETALRFQDAASAALDQLRSTSGHSPLDMYAAVNESEFFAVATEAFFLDASALRAHHEALYREMAAFYRQDPAADHH
ncbi:MAG: M90 family metallopeptidase [Acidimicrobiia bacterium]